MKNLKTYNEKLSEQDTLKFEFSFSFDDDNDDVIYGFSLIPPKDISIEEFWKNSTKESDKIYDKIENEIDTLKLEDIYGVHDIDGSIIKKHEYIFGYCTYEVPKEKIQELMKIWQNIFKKLGFEIGDEIIKYDNPIYIKNLDDNKITYPPHGY